MAEFDPEPWSQRFRERAEAVRKRGMPPVEGPERDALHGAGPGRLRRFRHARRRRRPSLEDGILTFRVDLRPKSTVDCRAAVERRAPLRSSSSSPPLPSKTSAASPVDQPGQRRADQLRPPAVTQPGVGVAGEERGEIGAGRQHGGVDPLLAAPAAPPTRRPARRPAAARARGRRSTGSAQLLRAAVSCPARPPRGSPRRRRRARRVRSGRAQR